MAIKNLLQKSQQGGEKKGADVEQLKDKLNQLKQKAADKPKEQQAQQQQQQPAAEPKKEDIDSLAQASEEEQRQFAQQQDPRLRLQEERTQRLISKQISELIELSTELNKRLTQMEKEKQTTAHRMETIEKRNKELNEKMQVIDQRLEKFMSLYEVITNQYNPFADADADTGKPGKAASPTQPSPETAEAPAATPEEQPEASSEPARKVQVEDGLTGDAKDVDIQQGQLTSENAKKMQQLLEELERDEREKRDADEDQAKEITVKEEEIQQKTGEEMHAWLAGFEERLKGYLDESVQGKLHTAFENLENVLNDEIQQAVRDEVGKLKEGDDILTSALQELEQLQAESSDEEKFQEEEKRIESEVKTIDDQIKAIPPSLYFRLHDGRVLKSKQDLQKALQEMSDELFTHHVTDEHNDFADWLELALEDPQGEELRGKTREQMLEVLS